MTDLKILQKAPEKKSKKVSPKSSYSAAEHKYESYLLAKSALFPWNL